MLGPGIEPGTFSAQSCSTDWAPEVEILFCIHFISYVWVFILFSIHRFHVLAHIYSWLFEIHNCFISLLTPFFQQNKIIIYIKIILCGFFSFFLWMLLNNYIIEIIIISDLSDTRVWNCNVDRVLYSKFWF